MPLASARVLARRIPNARLYVVEGGGHVFVLDEPERIIDELHTFLDENDGPAG